MLVAVPEECLWLIIAHLRYERATLHALLLTSSTFFRIAVKFLYASPFRLLDQERNLHWTAVQRIKKYDALVHLLLHSSQLLSDSTHRVPRLPRYGPEVPTLPTPSTVDYLSYYTDMFHDPMLHQTFMTLFPSIPNCYLANVIWYREMVEIRNRIELAMMDRVMPQVTTLTVNMPLQVPRIKLPLMANLRRLELLGSDACLLNDYDLEWGKANHVVKRTPMYAMSRLDTMLTFIWDHQRMFGTLRELKIENTPVQYEKQPDEQLVQLVEAMGDRLEILDVQFWPMAVLYLDRFPTQQLKCLLLPLNKDAEPRLEESDNMATFLGHCPNLQEIQVYTGERDLFKMWRPEASRRVEMSKMKRINIAGVTENVTTIVNEAVERFASTLQGVSARTWFGGRHTSVSLSWSGWALPRLTDLDLEGEIAWTFDFSSLLKCPRLTRIRLAFTGPIPSRSSKKQPLIQSLARTHGVQDLELIGTWVTLVNRGWPGLIARMYQLERLDLLGCDGITAEQVVKLVQDTLEESARWCLQGGNSGFEDRKPSVVHEYLYGHCRLRWVIVNKRMEDPIVQPWNNWKRWLALTASTATVAKDRLRFLCASAERVHFGFVPTARPSH
ncbi:MAG: hypothetical protein J3Q66DRAFT_355422 [Benniella sp.]|nr:MAG: hypothetical protein J3Q66DRAFT_355422 [Benniella sp.]